jgi:hypothetical protein
MQGRRLPDAVLGEPGPGWDQWEEAQKADDRGVYMKVASKGPGYWYLIDPFGHAGSFCPERPYDGAEGEWKVTEHEDGQITVSPSIHDTITYGPDPHPGPGYHGHLQAGVWNP